ncbi:MAG: ThuA domain-containing protein [Phycisphaerae bacterium]|nr:ThuA domain-containing protein [Phycisphaerae bacterium]
MKQGLSLLNLETVKGLMTLCSLMVLLTVMAGCDSISTQNPPALIKTLIVDGQNNHDWTKTTPVIKEMMEACGCFTVDVSTCPAKGQDMSGYRPDFNAYDLVVVNDGYGADSWPRETEIAFEKFVSDGGGVVIYHAADNAWPQWQAYNEMIAIGGWGGRNEKSGPYLYMDTDGNIIRDTSKGKGGGHGRQVEFEITIRDKNHPITKGMPATFMYCPDEMYAFLRGPALNVTILATAHSDKNNGGTGHEEPMLMTITYGKGHIFHTVLGHAVQQIRKDCFRIPFLRGAQWAATQKVTIEIPEGFPVEKDQD